MMQYRLNLNDRAFLAVKKGTKRVENRVKTDSSTVDYSKIKPNDIIIFMNSRNEELTCIVQENNWYKDEKELLIQEGTRYTLSSTNDFEQGLKSLTRFIGYKEGIRKNGIFAIHINKIQDYHEMKLKTAYFDYIKNGTKRIEVRLFDEKRKLLKLGDIIKFIDDTNFDNYIEAKIIGLFFYNDFKKLLSDFDIGLVADKKITVQEQINFFDNIYSKEKQRLYGILGIKIELI